jgi:hypothetical protein
MTLNAIILIIACIVGPQSGAAKRSSRAPSPATENNLLPPCDKTRIHPAVERLLKPVLKARVVVQETGNFFDEHFDSAVYDLVRSHDPAALEARVAAMGYYLGEHSGEELTCAVVNAGAAARPLVERYRRCRPRTSMEQELGGIRNLRTLYDITLEEISKGIRCEELD